MSKIFLGWFVFIICSSFYINPEHDNKVNKELNNYFKTDSIKLEKIYCEKDSCQLALEIYRINANSKTLGYLCFTQGKGRIETFDFIAILSKDKYIKHLKIIEYRSTYGYEIGARRWLNQFYDKDHSHQFIFNNDIHGISGATISGQGITKAINRINKTIQNL